MRLSAIVLVCLTSAAWARDTDKLSLSEAADAAVQQSKLTLPGSSPFHLKVSIVETTDKSSDYQATIEEFWVSPTKWRRTIDSPEFSQTLIVNGDMTFEKDSEDYFPLWLNQFVTAIFDPLPMLDSIKKLNSQIARPHGSANSTSCADLHGRVDRWTFCFEGSHGLLASVFTKGYGAEFKEYKKFGNKLVARKIVQYPEPGVTVEADTIQLTPLTQPDENMFAVEQPTPVEQRIQTIKIDENEFRRLSLTNTDIAWPPVGGGPATGGCAVYVSADRSGHVREAWPAGCDNAGLQNPLRQMVKSWQLRPATVNGTTVQVESLLGFSFSTRVDPNPLPVLSDAEARKLAAVVVEPKFPPGSVPPGTDVVLQISVDETGKLAGVQNTHNLGGDVFLAAYGALTKWQFHPYIKDGKPQYFHADLVFHAR